MKPFEKEKFGQPKTGEQVHRYTVANKRGMSMKILDYGGIMTELHVPDKAGKTVDVVLGFSSLDPYLGKHPYIGTLVGRYGNRIAKGRFTLDGKDYTLAVNNGPNHLHGGKAGYESVVWKTSKASRKGATGLRLKHVSSHMDEGYPGELDVEMTYWLTDENVMTMEYKATTSKPTHCNLTQHNYWNIAGEHSGSTLKHKLTINADWTTPTDATLIPTGEIRPVEGTPFDFRKPTAIGKRISEQDDQLKYGGGYDINFALNKQYRGEMTMAAKLADPKSGRAMEIWTREPGVQLYTGNYLGPEFIGKTGKPYGPHHGVCLETQCFPDTPNKGHFPSTVLRPGEQYRTVTEHRFYSE